MGIVNRASYRGSALRYNCERRVKPYRGSAGSVPSRPVKDQLSGKSSQSKTTNWMMDSRPFSVLTRLVRAANGQR